MKEIDDTKGVSEYTGIPERTLSQWRYLSRGPKYLKIEGGRCLYRKVDVDSYLDANVVTPNTAA